MFVAMILMLILLSISSIKIFIGPTIWDRLLSLNLIASQFLSLIILYSSYKDISMYVDLSIVYVLLGFVGITFLSIYIQRKGRY